MLLQTHDAAIQLAEGISHTDFYGGLFVFLVLSAAQFFVQKGRSDKQAEYFQAAIAEIKLDIKGLNDTIAERILPRQEYENRHEDLQRRVESLENTAFLRGRRFYREGDTR